jgi:hypothetical protein
MQARTGVQLSVQAVRMHSGSAVTLLLYMIIDQRYCCAYSRSCGKIVLRAHGRHTIGAAKPFLCIVYAIAVLCVSTHNCICKFKLKPRTSIGYIPRSTSLHCELKLTRAVCTRMCSTLAAMWCQNAHLTRASALAHYSNKHTL